MIIQNRDGTLVEYTPRPRPPKQPAHDYYAAVPAALINEHDSLIDRIVQMAFDVLHVRRLTVRVYDTE